MKAELEVNHHRVQTNASLLCKHADAGGSNPFDKTSITVHVEASILRTPLHAEYDHSSRILGLEKGQSEYITKLTIRNPLAGNSVATFTSNLKQKIEADSKTTNTDIDIIIEMNGFMIFESMYQVQFRRQLLRMS